MTGARNPWVGATFGRNSLELAKRISDAYDQALGGADATEEAVLRPLVSSSWQRSLHAGVDPEHNDPPRDSAITDPQDRWAGHPLAPFSGIVEDMLGSFAYDAGHIVVIADADGCLLWSLGHPTVLKASESIGFTPGRIWAEGAVGTNGVGTALALDHPIQIFASEHFQRGVHPWVCAGAPVHDPATGEILGVIDVSSGIRAAHPYSLALVSAAANTIEGQLAAQYEVRTERLRARFFERVSRAGSGPAALIDGRGTVLASHPEGWLGGALLRLADGQWLARSDARPLISEPLADGAAIVRPGSPDSAPALTPMRLSAAGPDRLRVTLNGVEFDLSPRRSALLAALALAPAGMHAAELVATVYGPGDHDIALRAEVSRLRRRLGGLIATNPYRLIADVQLDQSACNVAATLRATP